MEIPLPQYLCTSLLVLRFSELHPRREKHPYTLVGHLFWLAVLLVIANYVIPISVLPSLSDCWRNLPDLDGLEGMSGSDGTTGCYTACNEGARFWDTVQNGLS